MNNYYHYFVTVLHPNSFVLQGDRTKSSQTIYEYHNLEKIFKLRPKLAVDCEISQTSQLGCLM